MYLKAGVELIYNCSKKKDCGKTVEVTATNQNRPLFTCGPKLTSIKRSCMGLHDRFMHLQNPDPRTHTRYRPKWL
ncbi:hypothetical protein ABEB36_011228 [Hypothenemus hampei]|uniref:Uncharacterized protein n=1 Tax=Hypothenemus hampei TaxID=57062 RepID=A0ABD1EEQ6_HYPHA